MARTGRGGAQVEFGNGRWSASDRLAARLFGNHRHPPRTLLGDKAADLVAHAL